MNLEQHLAYAEKQWLRLSFDFLRKEFSNTPLPSHDHRHHHRVWAHVQKLLTELEKQGIMAEKELVEALQLASMFHDAGMLKERGKEHGKAGVEIFLEFIRNSKKTPHRLDEIMESIRDHDDKSYYLSGRLIKEGRIQLLPALQIGDDLDAFGYIGIYRFTEIYLLRGNTMEDLGLNIIANLSGRYGNFMSNCSRLPEMIRIHSIRQHTIESFFRHYNLQIRKKEDTGEEPTGGPVEVVKQIYRQVMMNTPTIENICINVIESSQDTYVQRFFKSLKDELETYSYPTD